MVFNKSTLYIKPNKQPCLSKTIQQSKFKFLISSNGASL